MFVSQQTEHNIVLRDVQAVCERPEVISRTTFTSRLERRDQRVLKRKGWELEGRTASTIEEQAGDPLSRDPERASQDWVGLG